MWIRTGGDKCVLAQHVGHVSQEEDLLRIIHIFHEAADYVLLLVVILMLVRSRSTSDEHIKKDIVRKVWTRFHASCSHTPCPTRSLNNPQAYPH